VLLSFKVKVLFQGSALVYQYTLDLQFASSQNTSCLITFGNQFGSSCGFFARNSLCCCSSAWLCYMGSGL